MSGEPPKDNHEESEYIRLRKNLLNIGIFAAEILLLVFAGPVLVRFFFRLLSAGSLRSLRIRWCIFLKSAFIL